MSEVRSTRGVNMYANAQKRAEGRPCEQDDALDVRGVAVQELSFLDVAMGMMAQGEHGRESEAANGGWSSLPTMPFAPPKAS